MKKCPYCNESLSDNARFCHSCGEKYKETATLSLSKPKTNAVGPTEDEYIDLTDIFKVKELPDGTYEISYGMGRLDTYTVPPYVSRIGEEAFSDIEDLYEIYIGETVKYISIDAFSNNEYLTDDINVTLSQEAMDSLVTQNYDGAIFDLFPYADSMNVEISKNATSIPEGLFSNTTITEIEIPNSVVKIGEGAFASCQELESVTIGNSVNVIGASAFEDCPMLSEINLPNGLKEIGNDAFAYCTDLTGVEIPDSVVTIGDGAFNGCSSIETVTLGESVDAVGEDAFLNCDDLTTVYLKRKTKIGKRELFDLLPAGCEIERLPR